MGRTIGCFFHLEVYVASSGTTKATPQGGSCQVKPSFDPPVPCLKCVVSSNSDQQLERGFSCLVLGFLLD